MEKAARANGLRQLQAALYLVLPGHEAVASAVAYLKKAVASIHERERDGKTALYHSRWRASMHKLAHDVICNNRLRKEEHAESVRNHAGELLKECEQSRDITVMDVTESARACRYLQFSN